MLASPQEQLKRRRSDGSEPAYEPQLRILAVDDDRSYLRYLNLVLTRAGFVVETADNGQTAFERIRANCDVDLMLIDYQMPGIDGIETVRRIQAECGAPRLYTILLTAVQKTETKLLALDNGLDDFLSKESSESEIVAKIRSAARRLEMERQLHLRNEELQTLALTDELTGIANRRALFRAGEEILSSRRLAVVMFDLDRFKQINDTFGHLAGDEILADVAALFKINTRYGDVIGRYGGDEFVLLLPGSDGEEARQIAERVMTKIRQLTWTFDGATISVNAQYGVATVEKGGNLPELLSRSDQSLYYGKRRRNAAPDARPEVR